MSISYTKQPKEGENRDSDILVQLGWESSPAGVQSWLLTCLTKHPPLLHAMCLTCLPWVTSVMWPPNRSFFIDDFSIKLFLFFWGGGLFLCIVLELDDLELTDTHLPMHSKCLVHCFSHLDPWHLSNFNIHGNDASISFSLYSLSFSRPRILTLISLNLFNLNHVQTDFRTSYSYLHSFLLLCCELPLAFFSSGEPNPVSHQLLPACSLCSLLSVDPTAHHHIAMLATTSSLASFSSYEEFLLHKESYYSKTVEYRWKEHHTITLTNVTLNS